MRRRLQLLLIAVATVCLSVPAPGQDSNLMLPVAEIEQRLRAGEFELQDRAGARFEGDRTQRVTLMFLPDSVVMRVKWARAAGGGERFNNVPRYEIAAYELQKLFLDEKDYVVPPTVLRSIPLAWYQEVDPRVRPTFRNVDAAVLVVLQYWLWNVTDNDFHDPARFEADPVYARHLANMNILTYLVDHKDANRGNFLISTDTANPRLFSVDHGVAFRSVESNRGTEWRNLQVDRLPAATVDRLRRIERADLERALGVVAEFEIREGELIPVEPSENLSRGRGIRLRGNQLQLGLTAREIAGVDAKRRRLLRDVDAGRIKTF